MEQLELFEPIPTFLVGVRVKDEPIQNYTIQALDHAQAIEFVRQALVEDKIEIQCIIARQL